MLEVFSLVASTGEVMVKTSRKIIMHFQCFELSFRYKQTRGENQMRFLLALASPPPPMAALRHAHSRRLFLRPTCALRPSRSVARDATARDLLVVAVQSPPQLAAGAGRRDAETGLAILLAVLAAVFLCSYVAPACLNPVGFRLWEPVGGVVSNELFGWFVDRKIRFWAHVTKWLSSYLTRRNFANNHQLL
jgi:hypothetical protein